MTLLQAYVIVYSVESISFLRRAMAESFEQRLRDLQHNHSKNKNVGQVINNAVEYLGQGLDARRLMDEGFFGAELADLLLNEAGDVEGMGSPAYLDFWIKFSIAEALAARQAHDSFAAQFRQAFDRPPASSEFLAFISMKLDKISDVSNAGFLQYAHAERAVENTREEGTAADTARELPAPAPQNDQAEEPGGETRPPRKRQGTAGSRGSPAPVYEPMSKEAWLERGVNWPRVEAILDQHLTPLQNKIIRARYDRQQGLRNYGQVLALLEADDDVATASRAAGVCREALRIISAHDLIPLDLLAGSEMLEVIFKLPPEASSLIFPLFGLNGGLPVSYEVLGGRLDCSGAMVKLRHDKILADISLMLERGEGKQPRAGSWEGLPENEAALWRPRVELGGYLVQPHRRVIELRYAAGSRDGLRAYDEVISLADAEALEAEAGNVLRIASLCGQALKTLAMHNIRPEDLPSDETLALINRLSETQRAVIAPLFGLGGQIPVNYQPLGERLGLQSRKVRQIEKQAIRCLRRELASADAGPEAESPLLVEEDWIDVLDLQSRQAVILRYGLDGSGMRTHRAVGKELCISTLQASAVVASALEAMRQEKGVTTDRLFFYPHFLEALEELDVRVIEKLFGLDGGKALSHQAAAEALDLTVSQVRKKEAKAIETFRREPSDL